MIDYTYTATETTAHAPVYDRDGNGYRLEAISPAHDPTAQDTIEEALLESLENGAKVDVRDLAVALVAKAKREIMGEILVRLLCILSESENVKLDCECLIAAAGLKIRDEPDASVAARYGISRQSFGARKKMLMKKLNLAPPPHSKSLKACETYRKSNRINYTIED